MDFFKLLQIRSDRVAGAKTASKISRRVFSKHGTRMAIAPNSQQNSKLALLQTKTQEPLAEQKYESHSSPSALQTPKIDLRDSSALPFAAQSNGHCCDSQMHGAYLLLSQTSA